MDERTRGDTQVKLAPASSWQASVELGRSRGFPGTKEHSLLARQQLFLVGQLGLDARPA